MKKRWRKFNFTEWRSDPDLLRCSRAARSLWVDLVGLIYDAESGGLLTIKGCAHAPTDKDISAILGDDPRTIRRLMGELEAAGVFDVDPNGFVVSRRIAREEVQAKIDKEYGKRGGNPALKNKPLEEKWVNPQKPEPETRKAAAPKGGVAHWERDPWAVAIFAAAGPGLADPVKQTGIWLDLSGRLARWRHAGWDLETHVLPVVTARTARVPESGPYGTFRYIEDAIALFVAKCNAPPPTVEKPHERAHQSRTNGNGGSNRRGSQNLDAELESFLAGRGVDSVGSGSSDSRSGEDIVDASYEVVR